MSFAGHCVGICNAFDALSSVSVQLASQLDRLARPADQISHSRLKGIGLSLIKGQELITLDSEGLSPGEGEVTCHQPKPTSPGRWDASTPEELSASPEATFRE
jgi:hypothetical protein